VKCGADSVYAAANGVQFGDAGQVAIAPNLQPGFRGAVRRHRTDLWSFACTRCGHLEFQLLDPAALGFIAQQWSPVPPVTEPRE
jgi:hypothetical protein